MWALQGVVSSEQSQLVTWQRTHCFQIHHHKQHLLKKCHWSQKVASWFHFILKGDLVAITCARFHERLTLNLHFIDTGYEMSVRWWYEWVEPSCKLATVPRDFSGCGIQLVTEGTRRIKGNYTNKIRWSANPWANPSSRVQRHYQMELVKAVPRLLNLLIKTKTVNEAICLKEF